MNGDYLRTDLESRDSRLETDCGSAVARLLLLALPDRSPWCRCPYCRAREEGTAGLALDASHRNTKDDISILLIK